MNLNQTLQEKYPHLEVSVLKLSEAQKDNESKRIDSEYFKKEYLENEAIIKIKDNYAFLENFIVKMTGGATPLGADYPDKGIPFLRVQNIMQNYFNVEDIVYISQQDDEYLKRSRLKFNDVLLTITGISYGKSAVVERDLVGANINQHSVKIEVKNINPYFLSTFLNSKFGKLQSDKKITGVTRPALDYQSIKKFLIPIFPMEFQLEIQNLVKDSHKALEESKELYKKAVETLYLELGLDPKNPLQSLLDSKTNNPTKSLNISIHTLKESFLKTGRLDSEYYQKKYEINEKIIMNKKYTVLDNLVSITKSIEPGSNLYKNKGIPFIRVANLTQYGLSEADVFLDEKDFFPQYLQILYPKKDTILFSKDGSIGVAYCVKEDKEVVTSGAILHLNIKDKENILPEYLTLFLNSVFVKLQAQRDCGGSIISHWRIEDINKVLVAILDIKTQEKIAKYIQESFNLRKKSKQLLDNAKIKVEEQIQGKV
ncbi:TPA: restriction endonuclease subunit S [Campylobacter jejuni]|uniref:restriction endonuclease subunit S n=1 Tax=Campylobacter TaxID=194 RepID=UPI000BBC4E07|nr:MULTISPECIES: DNA methylase [Campylobacter]EAL4430831.1 restriction endonuclease subunit S [Campylobacter jejuni]EAL6236098.1 restriction endonuclease subunit S [Campylobacter jejuni]ECL0429688.1 restriction endonuclease subunit S [Campylobacter jejuni]EDP2653908.1 restriction endonuclease subunit S [Campylobacter jejuni]EDP4079069.1 restriction endonuclease subunit S [Campylobacter jejuni]